MATAGLVVRFDRHEVLPILKRVRCRRGVDELLIRMVTGQIPDDFAQAAERFTHTFGARAARVRPHPRRPTLDRYTHSTVERDRRVLASFAAYSLPRQPVDLPGQTEGPLRERS